MPTLRALLVELTIMLGVGIALALIGPFGSFAMGSLPVRLAYWIPAALGGYVLYRPIVLATTAAARALDLPWAAGQVAGVLLAAMPLSIFILWLGGNDTWWQLPPFEAWLQLYAQVALIGAGVTFLFHLRDRPQGGARAADQQLAPSEPSREQASEGRITGASPCPFMDRLPAHLRGRLIALEMEDHYVRAHAPDASALVLLRMRDAVAELAAVDGLRVHRSWWVAREAVEQVLQDGRNVRLRLAGGIEAPVARSAVPLLRASGWMD